jgi:3-oxoacyl-[acyl-carrier protein] reductase
MAHVAIVTGANHGIGAATARTLAARGCGVLCAYWPLDDPADPGLPDAYRRDRAANAEHIVAAIRDRGGRAVAAAEDLRDPDAAVRLFDAAESALGPVDILINNASGWVADTFTPATVDRLGRTLQPVSEASWTRQFGVDAMAPALLIAEFARRHAARGATWGRIIGLTSGSDMGFPQEVSYGAAKAAQTNFTMSAAIELASLGVTANMVYPPVTDTGWITESVRQAVNDSGWHVATPGDVAEVISYLASEASGLITGNVITLR